MFFLMQITTSRLGYVGMDRKIEIEAGFLMVPLTYISEAKWWWRIRR